MLLKAYVRGDISELTGKTNTTEFSPVVFWVFESTGLRLLRDGHRHSSGMDNFTFTFTSSFPVRLLFSYLCLHRDGYLLHRQKASEKLPRTESIRPNYNTTGKTNIGNFARNSLQIP